MVVLLTGASGLLGTWVRASAPEGTSLVAVRHRQTVPGEAVVADLRDRDATATAIATVRPSLVIHAAFARDESSIVDATRHVAEATAALGATLLLVSSEAVFAGDGRPRAETDLPDPVWDYGEWKAAAEQIAMSGCDDTAIVRLPLITSVDPEDHIVRDIRAAGASGKPSAWFTDEIRQPASGEELAAALWAIALLPAHQRSGFWHLPGSERLSRVEIAARSAAAAGLDPAWIVGRSSPADLNRPQDLHLTGDRARHELAWAPCPIYPDGAVIGNNPAGRPYRPESVLVLPKITASVVAIRDGTVLLTMREDFEVWCVPSGHVELGESLEDAARRETLEETGYEVALDRFVGMYSTIGDWPDMHSATFAAHIEGDRPVALSTPHEVLEVGWFAVEELPSPMMWWQTRRILDAVNGGTGLVYTESIQSQLGRLERTDLYRARDESGLSRAAFFEWNFGSGAA